MEGSVRAPASTRAPSPLRARGRGGHGRRSAHVRRLGPVGAATNGRQRRLRGVPASRCQTRCCGELGSFRNRPGHRPRRGPQMTQVRADFAWRAGERTCRLSDLCTRVASTWPARCSDAFGLFRNRRLNHRVPLITTDRVDGPPPRRLRRAGGRGGRPRGAAKRRGRDPRRWEDDRTGSAWLRSSADRDTRTTA
jgi:hypothetical protein